MDLTLNNLQRLICHKKQTNKQTKREEKMQSNEKKIEEKMMLSPPKRNKLKS